jgi:hypothetical protein
VASALGKAAQFGFESVSWVAGVLESGLRLAFVLVTPYQAYIAAGVFGAVGAVFSIALRVHNLELIPYHESFMNLVMSGLRVWIGTLSGAILLLLLCTTAMHNVLMGSSTKGSTWAR